MPSSWYPAAGTALALLALFGIPARRMRKVRNLLGIALLLVAIPGWISACGGGGNQGGAPPPPAPTPTPGTTAGTYTVTVVANSASLSATTTTMNVVVQ
jgi:hypothetical protein